MFKTLENIIVKTNVNVFGRIFTYHYLPEVEDRSFKGIFDNAHIEIQGVSTVNPIITLYEGDLFREPSVKDKLTINSVLYKIIDIRPDGVGGILLVLQKE